MTVNEVEEFSGIRDRFALSRAQLLADYAAISKKRRGAAEATALRLRSRQYLDIMAAEASMGVYDWAGLECILRDPKALVTQRIEPMVMAEIGRVLLLQQLEPDDTKLGVSALRFAIDRLPKNLKSRRFRKLLIEHFILSRMHKEAEEHLDAWPDVDRDFHSYLRGELSNPYRVLGGGDLKLWLENFNRPFEAHELSVVELVDLPGAPFDRLCSPAPTSAATSVNDDDRKAPRVSVILTTYNPSKTELATSLNSILNQTLSDLEVIVVDDASDAEQRADIDELAERDARVKVVHVEDNGGTYRSRNIGLAMATGKYVTGQDDDDWSHPERLAEQVRLLETRPDVIGCRVESITCLPDLSRVRLGYKASGANASSLMMRLETYRQIGGFLETRKAADTELHRRVEKFTGKPIVDIEKPLTIVRIETESLSRSEFRAGWSHPARREFKFSYSYWHATARRSELTLDDDSTPMVHIPGRFRIDQSARPAHLDVVYAGDWRQYGGPQKSMIEEIHALVDHGFNVGVMQLEAPRFMTKVTKPLTSHVQHLINSGLVHEVLYDDELKVDLLVLRYPPILQFATAELSGLQVQRMMILANQAPSELDGSDIRYLVQDCTRNAQRMFTHNVTWVPQGPQVREAIESYLPPEAIETFDIPGIVKASDWKSAKNHRRSTLPVVGRHSRDNRMKWPEAADVIEKAYPTSGRFDIRILGGASVPKDVLGVKETPAAWTVYGVDALPVPAFLRTLDFYVFFQNSVAVEAFGRSVLEALAAGLIVILPKSYEEVFGEAAIYVSPDKIQETVMMYHNDRHLFAKQLDIAERVVADNFSHESYVSLIDEVLKGANT